MERRGKGQERSRKEEGGLKQRGEERKAERDKVTSGQKRH